jgi:hypothetical protein
VVVELRESALRDRPMEVFPFGTRIGVSDERKELCNALIGERTSL